VFYTQNGKDLFVICTKFPEKALTVKGAKSNKVSMLGLPDKVSAKSTGSAVTINIPAVTPGTSPCNYAWVFKLEGGAE
jgi:alpha-L-fucosidase